MAEKKMRLIKLSSDDCILFGQDISPDGSFFFRTHLDAFKRMWQEQGSTFWLRFLITYQDFTWRYGYTNTALNDEKFPFCREDFLRCLDEGYIRLHKNFIEGRTSNAKNIMFDIIMVARHQHLLPKISNSSLVNDPFYARETRDSFRNIFGKPCSDRLKPPIWKILFAFQLYSRFAGAVCEVLRRWLDSPEITDESNVSMDSSNLWTIPQEWKLPGYIPKPFQRYIARFWQEKLCSMLWVKDIHKTLLSKTFKERTEEYILYNWEETFLTNSSVDQSFSFEHHCSICGYRSFTHAPTYNSRRKCVDCTFSHEHSDVLLDGRTNNKEKRYRSADRVLKKSSSPWNKYYKNQEEPEYSNIQDYPFNSNSCVEDFFEFLNSPCAVAFKHLIEEEKQEKIDAAAKFFFGFEQAQSVYEEEEIRPHRSKSRSKSRHTETTEEKERAWRLKLLKKAEKKFQKEKELTAQAMEKEKSSSRKEPPETETKQDDEDDVNHSSLQTGKGTDTMCKKEEMNQENVIKGKRTKTKKKKRIHSDSATQDNTNNASDQVSIENDPDIQQVSAESFTSHKSFNSTSEKLDHIEREIKETGGINFEEFKLMLEIGKDLMGKPDSSEVKKQYSKNQESILGYSFTCSFSSRVCPMFKKRDFSKNIQKMWKVQN
ncbi:uncharacterized protein LOC111086057 isoform X2 [Limulus polyphemus]|uniref:Uncharacterized protein LOC111086057 isoform X2 n=1 Tax=Limulus polyphemus TaxID=6850 RepID=A0ABM1SHQ9_LIMPO|nr:uncharacterized protein LOC111086057 isoform X2 [Limulus polyphemus]